MAKKKKAKKAKLPKRIGGIKIPKSIRNSSGPFAALLDSKVGREAAAAGLVAIAGSLLGSDAARRTAGAVGHGAHDAGTGAADALGTIGKAAGSVVAEAARRVLPAALTDKPNTDPGPDTAGGASGPEPERRRVKDDGKHRNH